MHIVDKNSDLNEYFCDEKRKIPKNHLDSVCKYNRGKNACRYICLSMIGFVCTKKTPAKTIVDNMVNSDSFKAKSDNCEGL